MTTIAWDLDRGMIAADGLACSGNTIIAKDRKKIVARDGAIYALTGCWIYFKPLIEWHKVGADPNKLPVRNGNEMHWSLLVITEREGRAVAEITTHEAPYFEDMPRKFALGSGCDVALGAMRSGKTPAEAVAIAMTDDVKTGGEIQVIDIAEALGLKDQVREAAE